jgi:glycine dehydrogenase subunit 2
MRNMETQNVKSKIRDFHQAKWDEQIIFQLSNEGERGILVPKAETEIENAVGDGISLIPEHMVRRVPPAFPAMLGSGSECRHRTGDLHGEI